MMPNVTRGVRMRGLLEYLAGPGKANEHTEPHLVAGSAGVMAWNDDSVLDMVAARGIAAHLDSPRRRFEVEVSRGSVWHCSLSVRSEEGVVDQERWGQIAEDFVEKMGFTAASGKAPCRWAAIHHGQSKEGNDHIHIAVSLVREDGTKASVYRDYKSAQKAAGELERKYDLEVLESRGAGLGQRGVSPAETAKAERTGAVEPERFTAARVVRAAAAASESEAEFVRRVRREGLLVRPRYAAGRTDVVEGYSVAIRPQPGQAPVWFGGGRMAKDLTLPRLRADWPDTPQDATAAAAEWKAASRSRRPAAPGREAGGVDPALWDQRTEGVAALRQALRAVPVDDMATWAKVAHDSAGAFAAWSLRVEATPGPLAATADALARSANVRAHVARSPQPLPQMRGASLVLAGIARGGKGTVGQAAMLRQLANTVKALHDAYLAMGRAAHATELLATARANLRTVSAGLPPAPERPGDQPARTGAQSRPLRAPGPVLPADLERAKTHARTAPGVSRGIER